MKAILPTILFVLGAFAARAGVVFDQPHTGGGALLMSSRYQPNGTDYDQYVWDSFSVGTAQAVTEIRWRGGYDPAMAYWGGVIVNFRVSIYASTPGLSQPDLGAGYPWTPATLISYDTGDAAGETAAGVFGGVPMYDYHFVLPTPFQAAAGTLYWVQIEAEMAGGLPFWGFAAGTGNGSYFRRVPGQGDYYFQFVSGDAAFSLLTGDGPIHTISATSSPADGGSIAGTGLYPENSAAPLVATPNPGYAFVNWTENGTVVSTAANYAFTVTASRALVANFAAGSAITTAASPPTGGTTNGDGSFVNGTSRAVEAVPNPNYSFVNWTDNGTPVSTNAVYTFVVNGDRHLVANFVPTATNPGIVFCQPPTATATLNPSAFLTPDGIDGECYSFDKFVIPATTNITDVRWRGGFDPAYGYWGPNPVEEFVIKFYASTANGLFVDFTQPVLKKVVIPGNADQTPVEVIGGVQMYEYHVTLPSPFLATGGTPYWIQIEASQAGYPLSWGIATGAGGNNSHFRMTTGAPSSNLSGDLAITLSAATPTTYAIEAAPSSTAGGSVSGGGNYAPGATATLLATANPGHAFVNWTEGSNLVASTALYPFTATGNRVLTANFQPTYSLALSSSSTTMGTVSGGGNYVTGSSVTAVATAKTGYVFLNWKEGSTIVSTLPNYAFTIQSARTLVATFAVGFQVGASASFAPGGSVSGAGGYATGSTVTLSATPNAGYQLTGWTENGTLVAVAPGISFSATTNRTLVAHFVPILGIGPSGANGLLIEWPASAAGWSLQENAGLNPAGWVNSTTPPSIVGDQNRVSVNADSARRLFRLARP